MQRNRITSILSMIAVGLTTIMLAAIAPAQHAAFDPESLVDQPFIRGVTISCFRSGPGEWDSPQMGDTISEINGLGGGWISFHPYARIAQDGSVRHREIPDDGSVLEPLRMAKERGVKAMLIPHIGYWGSGFDWRGEIAFQDDATWRRFFEQYTQFIVHQAQLAQQGEAAMFCVGIEYKATSHREADWRKVIAAVRQVYHGPVVYAANWDEFEAVKFWDALDYIGIQAYFPLSQEKDPTDAMLHEGWAKVLERVERFAAKHKQPVIFTELGYAPAETAASEPWLSEPRRSGIVDPKAEALKLRCMRIALQVIETSPRLHGVFLWKWFPSNREMDRDFVLQYPRMKQLLEDAWRKAPPARPAS
jgi:hypothetical protein